MIDNPNPAELLPEQKAVRRRSRARELALQALYLIDVRGPDARDEVALYLHAQTDDPETREFATELVEGVSRQREQIDERIAAIAQNWQIHRMAVVDRNILRIGTFELTALADIPPKVSINEAIELAKRYSTADSGAFVNGILDKIRAEQDR